MACFIKPVFNMPAPQPSNVFSPEGAIDLHVSPEMRASLRAIIDQKPKRLVVDLSRVPYVDSSGLAVLIGAMQSLEHEGGVFMLAGAQEAVRLILESARLDQYFKLFPSVASALAAP
jgi:anti-sigma B factor antagonist